MNKPQRELDLQELLLFLWHHIAVVLVCMLAGALGYAGLTLYKDQSLPPYQASALLAFEMTYDDAPAASDRLQYSSKIASLAGVVLTSDAVLEPAGQALTPAAAPSELDGRVSVSAVSDSPFMRLTVTGPDAESAQALCAAILDVAEEASLQMTRMGTLYAVSDVTVQPAAQASPLRAGLVGALLGAIVGLAVLAALELFDRTLHDAGDIAYYLDLAPLGVIPAPASKAAPLQGDAYRALCGALSAQLPDGSLLVVTGTEADAARAAAEGLAGALAESGRRVLLADAALHGAPAAQGPSLLGLLQQTCPPQDLPEAAAGTPARLPAGGAAGDPAALLGSETAQALWAALRARYDCTVLYAPDPCLAPETAMLARAAQGVLLAVQSGKTPVESAQLACRCLDGAPLLGAVVTGYAYEKACRRDGFYYALRKAAGQRQA